MLKNVRFGNVVLATVALLTGWLTLLALLVDGLGDVRQVLLGWGALLMAVAVLAGALNLLRVHLNRLVNQSNGWYSLFMVLGFGITFILGLLPFLPDDANTPISSATQLALNDFSFSYIIAPIGAALSALLLFALVLAGMRLLRRPPSFMLLVFLATAVVAVFSLGPSLLSPQEAGQLGEAWALAWAALTQVFAVAGARGLLIGMALGVLATGLRVLLALDRPYGD